MQIIVISGLHGEKNGENWAYEVKIRQPAL